jgi:hypothetical protein
MLLHLLPVAFECPSDPKKWIRAGLPTSIQPSIQPSVRTSVPFSSLMLFVELPLFDTSVVEEGGSV